MANSGQLIQTLIQSLPYYFNKSPKVGDYVLAKINNHIDPETNNFTCWLSEYNIEAILPANNVGNAKKKKALEELFQNNKEYILEISEIDDGKSHLFNLTEKQRAKMKTNLTYFVNYRDLDEDRVKYTSNYLSLFKIVQNQFAKFYINSIMDKSTISNCLSKIKEIQEFYKKKIEETPENTEVFLKEQANLIELEITSFKETNLPNIISFLNETFWKLTEEEINNQLKTFWDYDHDTEEPFIIRFKEYLETVKTGLYTQFNDYLYNIYKPKLIILKLNLNIMSNGKSIDSLNDIKRFISKIEGGSVWKKHTKGIKITYDVAPKYLIEIKEIEEPSIEKVKSKIIKWFEEHIEDYTEKYNIVCSMDTIKFQE